MPTALSTKAIEKSTYIITVSFTDSSGAAVVPNVVTWTLTTDDGTIVNSRDGVSATPAESVDIVLSGDDLQILSNATNNRFLTIEGTYDSDKGSGLPIKDQAVFNITNLVAVT